MAHWCARPSLIPNRKVGNTKTEVQGSLRFFFFLTQPLFGYTEMIDSCWLHDTQAPHLVWNTVSLTGLEKGRNNQHYKWRQSFAAAKYNIAQAATELGFINPLRGHNLAPLRAGRGQRGDVSQLPGSKVECTTGDRWQIPGPTFTHGACPPKNMNIKVLSSTSETWAGSNITGEKGGKKW